MHSSPISKISYPARQTWNAAPLSRDNVRLKEFPRWIQLVICALLFLGITLPTMAQGLSAPIGLLQPAGVGAVSMWPNSAWWNNYGTHAMTAIAGFLGGLLAVVVTCAFSLRRGAPNAHCITQALGTLLAGMAGQASSEKARVHALQQSQERYIAVTEHLGEGMLVLQNEHIVFANSRAAEIIQMSQDDIFADGFLSRVHTDDRDRVTQQIQLRVSAGGASERSEVRFAMAGQTVKWLEFGDSAVPWDGGQGLLIFLRDVTERHVAEQEVRTTLLRQQELNDLRSRFVAMTSHEFRTPLATILSAQDLLKNFEARMTPDQKAELLDMIEEGVHRMTAMMERVLLLGQADAAMLEFKPQLLDLPALCEDIVADVKAQSGHQHCPVLTVYSSYLDPGFYDKTLFHHIFSNLLSNAIKYSPTGGQVSLTVHPVDGCVVFEIEDQGIGIPASELGDLFVSFQRASNVGEIRGTGLGLAIVKQALELHGGTVAVRSVVGVGTCFTVRLPLPV